MDGDEDLPSLLCAAGIGFDDYEVKGLRLGYFQILPTSFLSKEERLYLHVAICIIRITNIQISICWISVLYSTFNMLFIRFDVSEKKRLYRGFLPQRSPTASSIVDVVLFKVEAINSVIRTVITEYAVNSFFISNRGLAGA